MKQLVIFDLDGTLLDTIEDLGTSVNYALHQMGFPTHTLEAYRNMVGNGVRRLVEKALPAEMANVTIVDRLLSHFKKHYDDHCCDATKPYPGIPELLSDLADKEINVAVASNKYQEAVTKIIRHYFPNTNWKAVLGNSEGIPRKPDPSIVFQVLLECPTPKSDVLYVGDSGVDMETARRACVESAGVTWGFRPETELRRAYADHIVTIPAQILLLTE